MSSFLLIMKVFLTVALLCFVLDGSKGDNTDCSGSQTVCRNSRNPRDTSNRRTTTNSKAEAILRTCLSKKTYFNCMHTFFLRCGSDTESEVWSSRLNLTNEMCDPKTQFHQLFVNNIDCVLEHNTFVIGCIHEAVEQERLYVNHYGSEQEVDEQIVQIEADCLNFYLRNRCVAGKLNQTCGAEASSLSLQMSNRFIHHCSMQDQETVFIKYLAMIPKSDNTTSEVTQLVKRSERTK